MFVSFYTKAYCVSYGFSQEHIWKKWFCPVFFWMYVFTMLAMANTTFPISNGYPIDRSKTCPRIPPYERLERHCFMNSQYLNTALLEHIGLIEFLGFIKQANQLLQTNNNYVFSPSKEERRT